MASNEYRKWLAIGSGVGIEIGDRDLRVTVVKVRPNGVEPLGALRIERFAERPAAEWGADYSRFLESLGGSHLAATVLLPRRDVIVRHIAMPGVSDSDLPQAISFQLDGLHPFPEDEAVHGWARMDDGANVLIGVTRREVIDRYMGLFAEAGVKVASLTFSAAALYASLRLLGAPAAEGFLAVVEDGEEMEAYGESPARPLFSAAFDIPSDAFAERARSMALSELRLPVDTPVSSVAELAPRPRRAPEGFDVGAGALSYVTAIAAACPRLGLHVNLLPESMRAAGARGMYIAPIVLGVLLLASAGGLFAYSSYEDRQYLASLQTEIKRLEPDARKPMQMDKAIETARAHAVLLDRFRKQTRDDLDALAELTRILEPPAWISSLELNRDAARLSGEAPQAAGLLKLIDKSPLFEGSEFGAPMSRIQNGEVFAIRTRREGGAR
ncbi:MAG: hypothetical protein JSU00_01640 [Acidobacteria bacterium]|nr:hypothetical protein [Acidobacteriota bacterium]